MSLPVIVVGAGGRMGKAICGIVEEDPELSLVGMVERPEFQPAGAPAGCTVSDDLDADLQMVSGKAAVIDFTAPAVSVNSAKICARRGAFLVIGTTGLSDEQKAEIAGYAKKTPVFWSPNMSIGVAVLQKILPLLTESLGPDYDVDILEIHHNRKKDAPSGTALHLGEAVAKAKGWELADVRCSGRDGIIGPRPKKQIGIQALRGGDVVGVHTVYFMGPGEEIEVTHRAQSRDNFARGAVRAAKWLSKQEPGRLYSMSDIF